MTDTIEISATRRALLNKYLQGNRAAKKTSGGNIPRRLPEQTVPLSLGQQQLWLLAQLLPDAPVYTECVTIHLPGALAIPVFERSFNEVLRRHEAWRTSFPVVDGQPTQRIHPYAPISCSSVDVSDLPAHEREAEALRLAAQEARTPFDLANGPLLRPLLVTLHDTDHRLFLTIHHIIFDGFSLYQIFLPELQALYDAFLAGRPSPLADLSIQYADFALWQRKAVEGDEVAAQLAYWKRQLANIPAQLDLPTDRPRPRVPTFRGAMHPFALSEQLMNALKALALQEGVTLYMLFVASFKILLARYTGQGDILVGTAISDRKQPELQKLVGFFLNTLVLRTDLSDNPTLHVLLQRVREVTLEALAHQDVPFEYLVKELHPERTSGQNPLFQVLISLEPPLSVLPSGWTLTQMDVETDTAKFDLSLELDDRANGLIGRFEYNTDLFDAPTIERMVHHWLTLLTDIVAHPTRTVVEFSLLTEPERQQVLVEWNDTAAPYPRGEYLHTLFEAQVEQTPDSIAAVCGDAQLTYQQLNARANRLAHVLSQQGVDTETLVGVCLERSLDMLVALLAILKAGAAYVPLDPAYPQERREFMLQDAEVGLLITQQKLLQAMPTHSTKTLCLDTSWEVIEREDTANLQREIDQTHLAYVIYTSGSTGRPKGVALEHRSAVAFVSWALRVFSAEDLAGVVAATSICFDLSIFELFVPLCRGGSVIIVENVLHIPTVPIGQCITLINTVPSAMTELIRSYALPPSVRVVNLAGEPLPNALVQQIYRHTTVQRVFNLYGPSEDTTYSTYALMDREQGSVSIGRPIANTQVYLLDAQLQPVPVGVAGELYLGGDGLARGYLNRSELTRERFIPNLFATAANARLYKTGDLARYMSDGTLDYLGRIDQQVKLRGFRIELGEIEALLRQQSSVHEAVVVVREDADKRLVAYVVATLDATFSPAETMKALRERLPEYMIPSLFVELEALPLLPNGKVKRGALPAPDMERHDAGAHEAAPTDMVQLQLLKIWEELLSVRPIKVGDNFFDLGGHSLLATRLVARVEQVCGKKFALSTLFAGPTIERMAEALAREVGPRPRTPLIAVQTGGAKRPFFFLHGDTLGGAFYCFPLARQLGDEQPFYALEPYQFADLSVPPPLETIAAAHIEALRAVQPSGPYLLGGFCNGALIVYEMARQLQAQGQAIETLVLIDPLTLPRLGKVHHVAGRVSALLHIGRAQQLRWFLRARHLYLRVRHDEKRGERSVGKNALLAGDDALYQDYPGVFGWLAANYTLRPYTGKTVILWAEEEVFGGVWKQKVEQESQIAFRTIAGSHLTCRTEHLAGLSEQLYICLREGQGDV